MQSGLKYGDRLEEAGFTLEKMNPDMFLFKVPVYALAFEGHGLGFYEEVRGEDAVIPIVDADFYWEATNGYGKMISLLAMVLPEKTLAIDCSDYSCYIRFNDENVGMWELGRRVEENTQWENDTLRMVVLNTIATA